MLIIKNGYFTYNGKIFGGLDNKHAIIANQNVSLENILKCKKALINKGYTVEIAI